MDARYFDAVARLVTDAGTRRGLLGLLATLPIVGELFALRDANDTDAQGRMRRKKRHKHGKGRHRGKGRKRRGCRAEPRTTTCAGRCGTVKNNCQKSVDCGACTCDSPCPSGCCSEDGSCQPGTSDTACGASGNCVDCGSGRRCLQAQGECVCDGESCANGCCDAQGQCLPDSEFSCGTGGGACTGACADDGADPGLDSEESTLLAPLNAYRVAEGRPALAPNSLLAAAAEAHALDMATRGYFSDIDPDGDGPRERIISQGYDPDLVAEIFAGGHQTAAQVFDAWRNSPGHAAIMLDPFVIEIGIGRAVKPVSDRGWYWSVNFASPAQD